MTVARGGRRPASAGPAAVALSTALGVALSGFGGSLSCGGPAAPAAPSGAPAEPTSRSSTVTVGFWNVANLFHPGATGPGQPSGVRRLSDAAYQRKLAGLAQGILRMGAGKAPEVVALAEVGSQRALFDLLRQPELRNAGYRAVRLDGPDSRGISNAALVRLPATAPPRHRVVHAPGEAPTRAVLQLSLRVDATPLVVFVNHWPSKRGGDRARAQREAIARRVAALVDDVVSRDPAAEVLVVGDFNAYLDERVFDPGYLGASAREDHVRAGSARLFHTIDDVAEAAWGSVIDDLDAVRAEEPSRAFGTYVYQRRWGTLDGILVHQRLLDRKGLTYVAGSAAVVRHPSLLYVVNRGRENAYEKPDRDISDHLPLTVRLLAHSAP